MNAVFNNKYHWAATDIIDATVLPNPNETISWNAGGTLLQIDAVPLADPGDTMYMNISGMQMDTGYSWVFTPSNVQAAGLTASLVDNYTGGSTAVSLSNPTTINFRVLSAAPASYAANRFELVFGGTVDSSPLSVNQIKLSATQQTSGNVVNWTVTGEKNVLNYVVEKSTEGISFNEVSGSIAAKNTSSSSYSWTDNGASGISYYRIKVTNSDGSTLYSDIVKVGGTSGNDGVVVYPNPVVGENIYVKLTGEAGQYSLTLYNGLGQKVLINQVEHANGTESITLSTGSPLAAGIYQLQVTNGTKVYNVNVAVSK